MRRRGRCYLCSPSLPLATLQPRAPTSQFPPTITTARYTFDILWCFLGQSAFQIYAVINLVWLLSLYGTLKWIEKGGEQRQVKVGLRLWLFAVLPRVLEPGYPGVCDGGCVLNRGEGVSFALRPGACKS